MRCKANGGYTRVIPTSPIGCILQANGALAFMFLHAEQRGRDHRRTLDGSAWNMVGGSACEQGSRKARGIWLCIRRLAGANAICAPTSKRKLPNKDALHSTLLMFVCQCALTLIARCMHGSVYPGASMAKRTVLAGAGRSPDAGVVGLQTQAWSGTDIICPDSRQGLGPIVRQ